MTELRRSFPNSNQLNGNTAFSPARIKSNGNSILGFSLLDRFLPLVFWRNSFLESIKLLPENYLFGVLHGRASMLRSDLKFQGGPWAANLRKRRISVPGYRGVLDKSLLHAWPQDRRLSERSPEDPAGTGKVHTGVLISLRHICVWK